MSTRSIIVVTGEGKYGSKNTTRLYKHSDGYPSGNLPIIAEALEKANQQCKEASERFGEKKDISVDQLVGLLIGASTCIYGMGARIDSCEDDSATYSDALQSDHFGNQWDLEWIYLIDLTDKSVKIYGGSYKDCSPQDHVRNGYADPEKYALQLMEEYQDEERARIIEAQIEVVKTGFLINPSPKEDDGDTKKTMKKKAAKNNVTSISQKQDAKVEIVRDGSKLRASHEGGWVRFPKKLRSEGAIFQVATLKPGRGGSWIACGEITKVAA